MVSGEYGKKCESQIKLRPKNSGPKFGRPKFVSQNSALNSGSGGTKSPVQTFVPDSKEDFSSVFLIEAVESIGPGSRAAPAACHASTRAQPEPAFAAPTLFSRPLPGQIQTAEPIAAQPFPSHFR